MSGGYDPNQTSPEAKLIQAQMATYKKLVAGPTAVAALGGLMAGIHLHQRAAESAGWAFRTRPRHRRARPE